MSCCCRLLLSGRRRTPAIFQISARHSLTFFSHSVNTVITCHIWTGDYLFIFHLNPWINILDITHLQRHSGDSPASSHTKKKPEETNHPAADTSEKTEIIDVVKKAAIYKLKRAVLDVFHSLYLLWYPHVKRARYEVGSRSGGPCSQPACPLRPSLQGCTAPEEHQQSAATALRSDRNNSYSVRSLNLISSFDII